MLFLFAALYFSNSYTGTFFNIFQGRDVRSALELLEGHLIWYGPEIFGGGHTPGPFYYWLLAFPLSIFGTWKALVWLNIVLISCAATVLWFVGAENSTGDESTPASCRTSASNFSGFLLFFLFLNSRIFFSHLNTFWNSSFLFIFQALILYWFVKSAHKTSHRKKTIIAASVMLGLSLQIHYMQVVFLAGLLMSVALAGKGMSSKKQKFKPLTLIVCFTAVPLIPYLIWSLFERSPYSPHSDLFGGIQTLLSPVFRIFVDPPGGFEKIQKNLLILFSSELYQEKQLLPLIAVFLTALIARRRGLNVPFVKNRILLFSWVISGLLCLHVIFDRHSRIFIEPFLLLSYVMAVPLLVWFQSRSKQIFLAVLLFVCFLIAKDETEQLSNGFSSLLFMLPVFLVLVGLFSFPLKPQHRLALSPFLLATLLGFTSLSNVDSDLRPKLQKLALQRSRLIETIIERTGWDYKTFRERTFALGFHREDEFQVLYEEILRKSKSRTIPIPTSEINGILIVAGINPKFLEKFEGVLKPNWEKFRYKFPIEIYRAGATQELECLFTQSFEIFDICFYNIRSGGEDLTWNNLGYPYLFKQPQLLDLKRPQGALRLQWLMPALLSRWMLNL